MTLLIEVGEAFLHAWLQKVLRSETRALESVGDDAALIDIPSGYEVLVSTDRAPLADLAVRTGTYLGHFTVMQNFSDIICKGGLPVGFLLVTLLRRDATLEYFQEIVLGAAEEARKYGGRLVGGDTKEHPLDTVVGTAIGVVPKGGAVARSGAAPDDVVAVTLTGGDRLGWRWACHVVERLCPAAVSADLMEKLKSRYVEQSILPFKETLAAIRTGAVTSSMDMTDGLGHSLTTIGAQSGVGFVLDEVAVEGLVDTEIRPVAEALGVPLIKFAWSPGFDWENLLTISPNHLDTARKAVRNAGGDLWPIGVVTSAKDITIGRSTGPRVRLSPFSGSVFSSAPRQQMAQRWLGHVDYVNFVR